jgi:hypothetical protein
LLVAILLTLLAPSEARAAESAAPIVPPPKAAAAAGPSPKAADAAPGSKAGAQAPAATPPIPAAPGNTAVLAAPAPSDAPVAPPAPSEAAPPAPPTKVQGGPPPMYYVEPPGAAAPRGDVPSEPPPTFIYEPPLPPEPRLKVPETALYAGVRLSWFVPFGSLWTDSFDSRTGVYSRRRTFDDYASSGPAFEFDLGARLARRYTVFAIMEHAFVGSGSLDSNAYGGQSGGRTSFYGAGLRFSTDPTSIGFLMEIALGYRDFRASWNDGTELSLTGGWLDARVGAGVDIRVNRYFSLSPMLVFGGGTFGKARWSGPHGSHDALDRIDDLGEYGTFSAQIGGHFDIY